MCTAAPGRRIGAARYRMIIQARITGEERHGCIVRPGGRWMEVHPWWRLLRAIVPHLLGYELVSSFDLPVVSLRFSFLVSFVLLPATSTRLPTPATFLRPTSPLSPSSFLALSSTPSRFSHSRASAFLLLRYSHPLPARKHRVGARGARDSDSEGPSNPRGSIGPLNRLWGPGERFSALFDLVLSIEKW